VTGNGGHDPVNAISEAAATGVVAETFADIRRTMGIPLITSIWRTLVAVDGGLDATWRATRPLYRTGQPEAALAALVARAELPEPGVPVGRLEAAGVAPEERATIQAILDVYNRSNGINFLALTALVTAPAGEPSDYPSALPLPEWPELPRLLEQHDIAPATWDLLLAVNGFGASPGESGLATLWRHLAPWPGLLGVIHDGLEPMQASGAIDRAIGQVMEIAAVEGARLAHHRAGPLELPAAARAMIANYVTNPGLVARMVTLGHGVTGWLRRA
jgi:hypothetical protein